MTQVNSKLAVPLYLQIKEELRAAIEAGTLRPLERIPSEFELAERNSVSRMTARKAIDHLVNDGIVFRQPGKGTFVAEPKLSHGLSTQLSFSASMARLGHAVTTEVINAVVVRAPAHVARMLNLPGGAATVYLRRLRVVGGMPAALHASYLPGLFGAILDQDLTGSLSEAMAAVGAQVATARDTVEAVNASEDEAGLLGVAPGAALVLVEGVAYSAGGEPLRYTEALYRGDRFRFAVASDGPVDLQIELIDKPTRTPPAEIAQ